MVLFLKEREMKDRNSGESSLKMMSTKVVVKSDQTSGRIVEWWREWLSIPGPGGGESGVDISTSVMVG